MPPGYTPPKKKTILMSPKHASQVHTLMAQPKVMAASSATTTNAVVSERVPVLVVGTDGYVVTGATQYMALKFTAQNPLGKPYIISVSPDLSAWYKIRMGTNEMCLIVYDFTYLTEPKTFYKFAVDSTP